MDLILIDYYCKEYVNLLCGRVDDVLYVLKEVKEVSSICMWRIWLMIEQIYIIKGKKWIKDTFSPNHPQAMELREILNNAYIPIYY